MVLEWNLGVYHKLEAHQKMKSKNETSEMKKKNGGWGWLFLYNFKGGINVV